MRKSCLAFLLSAALLLAVPSAAYETREVFPATASFAGYPDVTEKDWFYSNAKLCYETGLITGSNKGFEPYRTVTAAEAIAMAARIRAAITGEAIPAGAGEAWYQPSINYLTPLCGKDPMLLSLLAQPAQEITRYGFTRLLALVLPEDYAPSRNAISSLPDTSDPDVLRLYRAGILSGVSGYGFFYGGRTLTRSEAAAMLSRVARAELRLTFTPEYDPLVWASLVTPDAVFFQGEKTVTAGEFLREVVSLADALGPDFLWSDPYGDSTAAKAIPAAAMAALGVSAADGTDLYRSFDLPVFYSRLLTLRANEG